MALALALFVVAPLGCRRSGRGTADRPSFVVIMTDDQRWDTLEYMPVVERRMVDRGVSFTNSFVVTSACCPSRASFLTGQYPHNNGVKSNGPPDGGAPALDAEATIAPALKSAGYTTALIGKYLNSYHRLAPRVPVGWDEWRVLIADRRNYFDYELCENGTVVKYGEDAADYSTDVLRDFAVDFIRAHASEPFFLVYTPFAPHDNAGKTFDAVPAPRHEGALADIEPWRPPNYKEKDLSGKPTWVVKRSARLFNPPAIEAIKDRYRVAQLESLLAVDEAVDAILTALDEAGVAGSTMVVFTSDNGHMWGEHWHWSKMAAYEESIRVPLVIRYPPLIQIGREDDRLVLNLDLAPTIAELAGVDLPHRLDGSSLVPLLLGRAVEWREDFLGEFFGRSLVPPFKMVRGRRWKYIGLERLRNEPAFEELYDLEADPYELDNLLARKPVTPEHRRIGKVMAARAAELAAQ